MTALTRSFWGLSPARGCRYILLGLALGAPPLSAQERPLRFEGRAVPVAARPDREMPSLRPIRIAKWGALGASAMFAIYGFSRSNEADEKFSELERLCNEDHTRCGAREPGGAYADIMLEDRFQDVIALDRKARTALILSQVGVAASIVLFLLDLRNDEGPSDIPYVPRGLTFDRDCDRGWICLKFPV